MQPSTSSPDLSIAAEARDLSKLFGSFAALRHATCSFASGGVHALLGPNGAGKSTLLRIFAGLSTPTRGTAVVLGQSASEAAKRTAYMSHAPTLYDELSPAENLSYFSRLHRMEAGCGECSGSPEMALRSVGLDPDIKRPVSQLSQGMRQRVSMARVLLSDPELLLLDEPFSNLDVTGAKELVQVLVDFCTWPLQYAGRKRTVILTTHQHDLVLPVATSVVTLRDGTVVAE